jgi:hypothetical protein
MKRDPTILLTALIPAATLAAASRASVIEPGGLVDVSFTSLAERPDLTGQVVASQKIPVTLRASDGSVVYSLSILNEVIRNSPADTLSFSYRITNSDGSVLGLDRVDANSFRGSSADVASLLDGGGQTAPPLALRSDDGARVTFDFDNAASRIAQDASSFSFLVKTDAKHFNSSGNIEIHAFTATSVNEGSDPIASGAAVVQGFQPTSSISIPLPAAALVGIPTAIGVAIYTVRLRRRAVSASAD